jgi:hypothetical protein
LCSGVDVDVYVWGRETFLQEVVIEEGFGHDGYGGRRQTRD